MKQNLEPIRSKIYEIRGQRVMLDRDLAELYGVQTKVLNQAVKRNIKRFPDDFMFQLNYEETHELVTNCDRLATLKYSSSMPYAFTENGVAMLSSVLRSPLAIQVNIGREELRNLSTVAKFAIVQPEGTVKEYLTVQTEGNRNVIRKVKYYKNRQVKRNIERFPEDFMFQLTKEEWDSLRFQIGILEVGRGQYTTRIRGL